MKLEKSIKFSQVKYQYITIFGVNVISFCHGFAVGWLSPAVPLLKSEETPLQSPLTLEQTMWLAGIYHLGAILGNCVFGVLINYFGRITSMSFLALPHIVFWLTVLLANNFNQLVIGRFIAGLTGGLFVCIPLFVAEIANKEIRGFLGLMGPLIVAVGILTAYICGAFIEYRTVPYCIIGFPILFLVIMYFTPETPHTSLRRNDIEESIKAEKSMIFYNNGNSPLANGYNVREELNKLQKLVQQRKELGNKSSFKMIFDKKSLKGLLTGLALVAISIFSGIIVMTMHAAQLFIESGAVFDANISAIILGSLQVCGIYASSMLVDKIGRRILFGISSFGAAVSLFIFGIFSYLNTQGFNLSNFDWVPVVSGSFYIFINCVGIKPMPALYVAESLPDNVRHLGVSMCMMFLTLCTSVSVFTLPLLLELFGLYAVIWGYGCVCTVGMFFSIFVMTETKGKNLNQVQEK